MNDNFEQAESHVELPLVVPKIEQAVVLDTDKIDSVKKRLDALPPVQVLTTKTGIEKLLPSIKKMQVKGYSIGQIAAELSASGLPTSSRSLARLLSTKTPKTRQPAAKS